MLAQRVRSPGCSFTLVIGAEAWCERCRSLRPAFDALAAAGEAEAVFLWLDIEEHAEFVEPWSPADLPAAFVYQGGVLQGAGYLREPATTLAAQLADLGAASDDGGVFARLTAQDWAS